MAFTTKEKKRVLSKFDEINDFYRKNGRKPYRNKKNLSEFQLGARLSHLRGNEANNKEARALIIKSGKDKYKLLSMAVKKKKVVKKFNRTQLKQAAAQLGSLGGKKKAANKRKGKAAAKKAGVKVRKVKMKRK